MFIVMDSNGNNQTNLTINTEYFRFVSEFGRPTVQGSLFSSQRESVFTEVYTMSATNGSSVVRLTSNSIGETPSDWYRPTIIARRTPFDFDGDGKTDIGIFRPAPGEWWYLRSKSMAQTVLSSSALRPIKSFPLILPAMVRPILLSSVLLPPSGLSCEVKTLPSTVFRSELPVINLLRVILTATAKLIRLFSVHLKQQLVYCQFFRRNSSIMQFGVAEDIPMVEDYDGDGKDDLGVFRPTPSEWWIIRSSDGEDRAYQFGQTGDKPVPGDYTGDGKADVAIWRPSNANWFILRSEDDSFYGFPFGATGDHSGTGRL